MQRALAPPAMHIARRSRPPARRRNHAHGQGDSRTFLTHLFGRGLEDDRYMVERFLSMVDGEIRPLQVETPGSGRVEPRRIASIQARAALASRRRRCRIHSVYPFGWSRPVRTRSSAAWNSMLESVSGDIGR